MDRTKTTEVARKATGPRTPYVFGDKVIHNGATWTVIEDRGKNITLRLKGRPISRWFFRRTCRPPRTSDSRFCHEICDTLCECYSDAGDLLHAQFSPEFPVEP